MIGIRRSRANDRNEPDSGIRSAIGNTPVVRLARLFRRADVEVYAKLEGLNPGGSAKDRAAMRILECALSSGAIQPASVIVESSSGNMGIGLAQLCASMGMRFICVVDPKTTQQNLRLLKAYGAEVEMVHQPDPSTGEFLPARLKRVRELANTIPNAFWPNQYANICNAQAHHRTMEEIHHALPDVEYLFCATSTCGTLRGCSEYIRKHSLRTKIIAVDAAGSVIFDNTHAKRLITGHGASIRPALFDPRLADGHVIANDIDCIAGCRQLVRAEGILAGGSGGAVVTAIQRMLDELPAASVCVGILMDRGERYLDTIFSDEWVTRHFGETPEWLTQGLEVASAKP